MTKFIISLEMDTKKVVEKLKLENGNTLGALEFRLAMYKGIMLCQWPLPDNQIQRLSQEKFNWTTILHTFRSV